MLKKMVCILLVLCTLIGCTTFELKGLSVKDADREFSLEEVKASLEEEKE